jgi:hypothetical protein
MNGSRLDFAIVMDQYPSQDFVLTMVDYRLQFLRYRVLVFGLGALDFIPNKFGG